MTDRATRFRQQIAQCEAKAEAARTEETRRAWLICANGWRSMLEKEELNYVSEPTATLIPDNLQDNLRQLARKNRGNGAAS
jgi:hypothetical protein